MLLRAWGFLSKANRTVISHLIIPSPSLIARFMGPTWGPSGVDRTHVGPILAQWTLLSGMARSMKSLRDYRHLFQNPWLTGEILQRKQHGILKVVHWLEWNSNLPMTIYSCVGDGSLYYVIRGHNGVHSVGYEHGSVVFGCIVLSLSVIISPMWSFTHILHYILLHGHQGTHLMPMK